MESADRRADKVSIDQANGDDDLPEGQESRQCPPHQKAAVSVRSSRLFDITQVEQLLSERARAFRLEYFALERVVRERGDTVEQIP